MTTIEGTARAEVLSIDAWHDGDGWVWNDQYRLCQLAPEHIERTTTPRKACALLRELGYLSERSKGRVRVEYSYSDPEYVEIRARRNGQPLFAIVIYSE